MIPPIANRFVAGETPDDALDHAASVVATDIGVIINHLGEYPDDPTMAERDTEEYLELLDSLDRVGERVCISVKPSQLGLELDQALLAKNLRRIVAHAEALDRYVWIDMEDTSTTDATLDAFDAVRADHDEVGVCLQANLRRTPDDLDRFAPGPGGIRLVKGAYKESADVALTNRREINEAYRDQLRYLFEYAGGRIAVASHDPAMIELAEDLHNAYGTPYEVQMLMGVRADEQRRLADSVDMWQYIPYGTDWFAYFSRRAFERKENLLFAIRAIIGR